MPHGRIQQSAVLPRSKSCWAYAAHAIPSTWKNNFFADFLQVTKTVERDWWTLSDFFFLNWLIPFWNPYAVRLPLMGLTICWSNFYAAQHWTACCSWADATLTYTCSLAQRLLCGIAALCHCVLRSIMWTYLNDQQLSRTSSWNQ